jgi:hypothetical protein
MRYWLGFFILFISCKTENKPESSDFLFFKSVIEKNNIGHKYTLKQNINKADMEVNTFYLGELLSKGESLSLVYLTSYYGVNRQANSNLLVFDDECHLVGFYSIGGVLKDIASLKKNSVVFPPDSLGGCSEESIFDFTNSIPNEIFLECKDGMGDLYPLQKPDEWHSLF